MVIGAVHGCCLVNGNDRLSVAGIRSCCLPTGRKRNCFFAAPMTAMSTTADASRLEEAAKLTVCFSFG